jgi:hypothetical protein
LRHVHKENNLILRSVFHQFFRLLFKPWVFSHACLLSSAWINQVSTKRICVSSTTIVQALSLYRPRMGAKGDWLDITNTNFTIPHCRFGECKSWDSPDWVNHIILPV